MRNLQRSRWWGLTTVAALAAVLTLPHLTVAQEAAGFDGFVQSGTCEAPTDDVRVELESIGDYDVEPYLAKLDGGEGTLTLAYFGAPAVPGFSFATIFTDEDFSLVITRGGSDEAVACGDLLEPDDDDFVEAGLLLVRLQAVGGSGIEGVASFERVVVQREVDATSTRVRILLLTDSGAAAPPAATPVD